MRFTVCTACTQALHCCDLLALGPELPRVPLFSGASYKSQVFVASFLLSNEMEHGYRVPGERTHLYVVLRPCLQKRSLSCLPLLLPPGQPVLSRALLWSRRTTSSELPPR